MAAKMTNDESVVSVERGRFHFSGQIWPFLFLVSEQPLLVDVTLCYIF